MRFINRKEELNFLEEQYQKEDSSLVVLYGRRRIGKTTLIQKFIEQKDSVFFMATEENEIENIKNFQKILVNIYDDKVLEKMIIKDWMAIFEYYVNIKTSSKKLIIIDEFQYLSSSNASFPSVFQKIYDLFLKKENIMVIICGSLIHMMEEQTLSYSSPLYGRRTGSIKLKQISYKYYKEFFKEMADKELIEFYSVTGGVPKYIELFDEKTNIYKNIESVILNKQSYLYDEPIFLLQKEVSEIGSYFSIIKSIAFGNSKLSTISANIGISQTSLPKYLKVLINLDILERIVPITEDNPEKSKMGIYKIKDNFILFWFRFVYPNMSALEIGLINQVENIIKNRFIQNHVSFIYEDICRELIWNIDEIKLDRVGKWWNKNTEIDIVGINDDKKELIFGECKYTKEKIGIDIFYELKRKADLVSYKNYSNKKYVLFSMNGYTKELEELAKVRNDMILYKHK